MGSTPDTSVTADRADPKGPAEAVEQYMDAFLRERPLPRGLRDAIDYALLAPGKRIRPTLTIRSCEAVGGTAEDALPAAAAIEMVHCFSLVHDDLPAMDDDDLRRGRPTLHRKTNEAMAVLAGDAMLGLAFEVVGTRLPEPRNGRISAELATATNAMIAGQVYDTLPDFDASTGAAERLRTIHRHKTGALIRAACRMGAMCGRASEEQTAVLTRYAETIGMMFQIVDDLLDVTQSTEQIGKTAGKDEEQEKLTYPAVMGIEVSHQEVERLRREAHQVLSELGERARPLAELGEYLAVRTK